MNSPGEKICSRCHAVFTCGLAQGDAHCWCEALPHVPLVADEQADCFCPQCLGDIARRNSAESDYLVRNEASLPLLKEGEDYYLEGGAMVFTAAYHLKRGYCCESNCRHCPYEQPRQVVKS